MISKQEKLLVVLLTAALNPLSFVPAAGYVSDFDSFSYQLQPENCNNNETDEYVLRRPRSPLFHTPLCPSQSGIIICRGLLLMWLMQRPAGPLCDEKGAKPWVKRLGGFFFFRMQQNTDRTAALAVDAGAADAAEGADADRLLWHLSFGSNMNPEVLARASRHAQRLLWDIVEQRDRGAACIRFRGSGGLHPSF